MEKKKTIYKLTLSAVMMALSTALSFTKIVEMPLGGGVTILSMLPMAMLVLMLGTKWGFGACFVYSLIQMGISFVEVLGWGLSPVSLVATYLLDYILAYTVLGFSGIFKKKGYVGICVGVALAVFLRFVCHFISGAVIFDIWMPSEWSNPWAYSFCYNGAYMLPELILTVIGAVLLFKVPQIKKYID